MQSSLDCKESFYLASLAGKEWASLKKTLPRWAVPDSSHEGSCHDSCESWAVSKRQQHAAQNGNARAALVEKLTVDHFHDLEEQMAFDRGVETPKHPTDTAGTAE